MLTQWPLRKYMIRTLKIFGWIFLSMIALLLVLALVIQIPYVQHKLTAKAVGFLKEKIGTEVRLEHISLSFPKKIVLEGLYLEDQSTDTLLYAGRLSVNTNLWALTRHEIDLSGVGLDHFSGNIKRSARDSAFNFDYIVKAFAGDSTPTAPPDTTKTPWKFTVGNLDLTQIHVRYQDALEGNDADVTLATLAVDIDAFDLEGPVLKINSIDLENVQATILQSKVAAPPPAPSSKPEGAFTFSVEDITLKDIAADYKHSVTGQMIHLNLGKLLLAIEKMDLENQDIAIDKLSLSDTFLAYHQAATKTSGKTPPQSESSDTTAAKPWKMTLANLELVNDNVQYHNFREPFLEKGMDFNHLWVTRLHVRAEDLKYAGNTIGGNLQNLSLQEKSGFGVTMFKTVFALTDQSLRVKDFYFQSTESQIALNAQAQFASLASLDKAYPDARVDLNLNHMTVAVQDVLYFYPALRDSLPLTLPPHATVSISADAKGPVKDLSLEKFNVDLLSNTSLKASGTLVGLPDMKHAKALLTLQEFYTTAADVRTVVPDSLIPKSIALPEWIRLTGKLSGTLQAPQANAWLTTSLGDVKLDGRMNLEKSQKENYSAQVLVKDFELGKLLKQDSMGRLNMQAGVKGSGLSIDDLNARLDVHVADFKYAGYTYHDFKVNGTMKKYFFSGTAQLEDENLDVRLKGDLDYNQDVPEYKFVLELKNADLKALHLAERPLRARGTVDVDLATSDFKVINGTLDIRKVAIFNGEALYKVDSLLFASIDQHGESKITIRSDILSGDFKGTINLYSLPEVLRRHFDHYFSLQDDAFKKPAAPQNFAFNLVIKNTDLLTEIIFPELEPFVPGEIAGEFDSEASKLDLRVDIAGIKYDAVGVDSLTFLATSDKNSLDYAFGLRNLKIDTLHISAIKLTGKVADDSIRTKFTLLDSLQKEKYVWGGVFNSLENVFQFHFLKDEVIMNYSPWETPRDNALRFTRQGLVARHFSLTNINEKISLITQSEKDSTLSVVFKNLNLPNLTNVVEGVTPAEGLINGDFKLAAQGAFQSKLTIKDFKLFNQLWGDLVLAVERKDKPYVIDFRVDGEKADVKVAGHFTPDQTAPEIDLTSHINISDLAIVEPLSAGQLKKSSGGIAGDIKITGRPSSPDIRGEIEFHDASFVPSFVNSRFTLKNETLKFTEEGITIDNFTVLDENGNKATLKGIIQTKSYKSFDLNLTLNANHFQLLNTSEDNSDLFYGRVGIDLEAKITGNADQPNIRASVGLTDSSNFTYIVPQSEKGVLEQKGIVRWVDNDAEKDPFLKNINPKDTIKSRFRGLELTANIELTDKTTFNIIIDPVTDDKLSVKGNSTLTLDIDPTGNMQLTGRYEITDGSYDLSFYKLVKRKFKIEKGGSLTWAGDPLDATMAIRAIYTVETSPAELLAQTSAELSVQDRKQRMPFLVYLQLKGNLLAPEISFQLDMPENSRNAAVYAIIKDINTRESDLNKQVFALLILKRFITDNPFVAEGSSDVSATARRSVGRLLTEQLNRLSENIKGVQLTFDVKSYDDYSTGTAQGQTQVQLGVSKNLLNNRLVVKVSGNVDVEGEASSQESFADYIGDLALEYKLTEDGRLRITGFRNSNYDMIDGELIETGAGLIYIKDYNTLRELFKANEKEK
ncbi:translocation/assembly module TamB [Chryseolinea soli]|uniref:Translocation/assembly module TamB n=2 Tax=Chryseolinea soli TaxID=2321403 RepID=A0A385SG18_9BACT|nr:translocation/assembly module TamB [Chryseolinea soli]